MNPPSPSTSAELARNACLEELARICGAANVLTAALPLALYGYDGGVDQARPDAVVFPQTREHVVAVVRAARRAGLPLVARGAGTGLSGGAIARQGGLVVGLNRMQRVLDLDLDNARVTVEPGVVNQELSDAIAHTGFYFAPDPSSQRACTIGGNIAQNSGGPHTLACGVTVNHVTGLELVLASGEVVEVGGKALDAAGYDLTGVMVGSEGTLALVTAATLKLTRLPEAVGTLLAIFDTVAAAAETVAAITAAGITPAALEMLDGFTLRAVEATAHAGYPLDAEAVLLIEVEGLLESVAEELERLEQVCRAGGARALRRANNDAERAALWKGRKGAFAALGQISPGLVVMDGAVPRTQTATILERIERIRAQHGLQLGNVFHAGDGNLHPIVCFDPRDGREQKAALAASRDIVVACVELGGSISGEHGIGMEKNELMPLAFTDADLRYMETLRRRFNPDNLLSPGKVLPARYCQEIRVADRMARQVTRQMQ